MTCATHAQVRDKKPSEVQKRAINFESRSYGEIRCPPQKRKWLFGRFCCCCDATFNFTPCTTLPFTYTAREKRRPFSTHYRGRGGGNKRPQHFFYPAGILSTARLCMVGMRGIFTAVILPQKRKETVFEGVWTGVELQGGTGGRACSIYIAANRKILPPPLSARKRNTEKQPSFPLFPCSSFLIPRHHNLPPGRRRRREKKNCISWRRRNRHFSPFFPWGQQKFSLPSHGTRIHNKLPRKLAPNLNELYLKSPSFRKITDDHLKISLMKSIKVFLRMKQLPVSSSTQLVFKFFSAIPNLHRRLILTFLGEREVWEGGGLLA